MNYELNIKRITFSIFQSSMVEIETLLDDISKNALQNKAKRKNDILQNLIHFDTNEHTILLNTSDTGYNAVFFQIMQSPQYICMVSSVSDGWFTLFNVLSSKIKRSCFHFQIDETESPIFMMVAHYEENERIVYTLKDSRWMFYEKGEILPFENKMYYQRAKVSMRLNKSILTEYCRTLGFNIADPNFWHSSIPALFYSYAFKK